MDYEIFINIIFDLLSNKIISASSLARKYGVSSRTIVRYMDKLSISGIPVLSIKGKNGGFKMMDSYTLPASFMSKEEFNVTISTLESFNNQVQSNLLTSAIAKIKAVDKKSSGTVNVKTGNIVIDEGAWSEISGGNDKLKQIEKSIESCNVLTITYFDRNGEESVRETEPYFILFKQGIWYVYAYCRLRKDFRIFKISRIISLVEKSEKFEKKQISGFNIDYSKWFKESSCEEVTLKIDKNYRTEVEEWLGVSKVYEEGGEVLAKATLPIEESLVTKILSFAGNVKVISPESLQVQVKDKALEIAKAFT